MRIKLLVLLSFIMVISGRTNGKANEHWPLQPQIVFSAGNVAGNINEEILVPFTVGNFNHINNFHFSVSWNSYIAEFLGAENVIPNLSVTQVGYNVEFDFDSRSLSLPENTVIAYLRFALADLAGVSTPVYILNTSVQVFGGIPTDNFAVNHGSIAINLHDPIIFHLTHQHGNQLSEVNLPMTVENFDSVTSMIISIRWDETVATLVEFQEIFPSVAHWTTPYAHGIEISRSFPQPLTLNDLDTLFNLRFQLIGNAGDSTSVYVDPAQEIDIQVNYNNTSDLIFTPGSLAVDSSMFHFYGLVEYANAYPLNAVTVSVTGAGTATDTTNQYGEYDLYFSPSATGSPRLDLFLTKNNDTQPLNGIDMEDVELIRDYIEAPERTFTFAEQVIAADVDPDNIINEYDAQFLEDIILGITDMNHEKRWTFLLANQEFTDIHNPFPYQFEIAILDYHLSPPEVNYNFIGIKRGDVDFDRDNTQAFRKRTELRDVELEVVSIDTQEDIVDVQIRTSGFKDIRAYQFTLNWNPTELQLLKSSYPKGTREGAQFKEKGALNVLWRDEERKGTSLDDQSTLMTYSFEKKTKGSFSPVTITGSHTEAKMFDTNLTPVNLMVRNKLFTEASGSEQFYPNPFSTNVTLNVWVTEDQIGNFSVMNANGKIVSRENISLSKGSNKIVRDGRDLPPGVYLLKVTTKEGHIVNKVIKK